MGKPWGVVVALGDEDGVENVGDRKEEGEDEHYQNHSSTVVGLKEAEEHWQEEGLD